MPIWIRRYARRRSEACAQFAAPPSEETLRGYVLYSACDAEGACLYRRQDFEAVVRFPAPPMGDGPPGDGGPDGSNPDGSNPDGQGSEGEGAPGGDR